MTNSSAALRASVIDYCAAIGSDPLLVQGAGGNVSWKDGEILWVKASGTWLAQATEQDIFLPVDLMALCNAIAVGDFAVTPVVCGGSVLRPSIETLLHALMPHRVVVHLHAVEVLARLVHENCQADFQSLLNQFPPWVVVDYYKPGADLAAAICAELIKMPAAKVIFLKNHGVVIGGSDVAEVKEIINYLTEALTISLPNIADLPYASSTIADELDNQYTQLSDVGVHQLAINPVFFKQLSSSWALCPDHVVFLGPKAYTYRTWDELIAENRNIHGRPELVFIYGEGVYAKPSFNMAKRVQLRCYYDVISRQNSDSTISVLSHLQIADLLNWDAEQYRMTLAR